MLSEVYICNKKTKLQHIFSNKFYFYKTNKQILKTKKLENKDFNYKKLFQFNIGREEYNNRTGFVDHSTFLFTIKKKNSENIYK